MTDGVNRAGSSTPPPYSTETTDQKDEAGVDANLGLVKRNIRMFEQGDSSRLKQISDTPADKTPRVRPDRKLHERKSSKSATAKPQLKPKPTPEQIQAFDLTKKEAQQKKGASTPVKENIYNTLQRPGEQLPTAKSPHRQAGFNQQQTVSPRKTLSSTEYAVLQPVTPQLTSVKFQPGGGISLYASLSAPGVPTPSGPLPTEPLYASVDDPIYDSLHFGPVYENVEELWGGDGFTQKSFTPRREELPDNYQTFWPSSKPVPVKPEPYHKPHASSSFLRYTTADFRTDEPVVYATAVPRNKRKPQNTKTYDFRRLQESLEKFSNDRLQKLRINLPPVSASGGKKGRAQKKAQDALKKLEARREQIALLADLLKTATSDPNTPLGRKDIAKIRRAVKSLNEQLLPIVKVVHGNSDIGQHLLPVPPKPGRR